jgi:hypothetical protein
VQGDAGHPGEQGGGHKKNNWEKWRAEKEERHKGLLIQKRILQGRLAKWCYHNSSTDIRSANI